MIGHTKTAETLLLDGEPLPHTVYRADSLLAKARGVMGQRGLPDETALVFPLEVASRRSVHMLGVRAPIRVWWVRDRVCTHSARLSAWTGMAAAEADMIVELPADAPDASGATVRIE